MPKRQILVLDTLGKSIAESKVTYAVFQESAEQLSVGIDLERTAEEELTTVVSRVVSREDLLGIILLRSPGSLLASTDLETHFSQTDLPVVELFLESRGDHERIDKLEPGRKIIRTIYGRHERGIFWAMQFLLHAGDYRYETLSYGPLDSQIGDLMLPADDGPHPVVMLIHGGFWRDAYYRDSTHGIAADLAKKGIAVWNIEYRRVGESGGGFPESHQDVLQALNYLQHLADEYPLDLERVAITGHSAGGYLALWAAAIPQGVLRDIMPKPVVPVKLAISIAGVTDLDEAHKHGGGEQAATNFLKTAAEDPTLRQQLSIGYLTFAPDSELILAHGTDDSYVPVELSEYTYQLLQERGIPAELLLFPDTDHNEFVSPKTEQWLTIAKRITTALKNR